MSRHRLAVNTRVAVRVPRALLQQVLDEALRQFGPREATETSLAFVSPQTIAKLNRRYRGKRTTTDVLSFPLYDGKRSNSPSRVVRPIILGEVVIAPKIAHQRAKSLGHPLRIELALLFLHGLLHLLGMQHERNPKAKAQMRQAEASVARRIPTLRTAHAEEGLLVRELVWRVP